MIDLGCEAVSWNIFGEKHEEMARKREMETKWSIAVGCVFRKRMTTKHNSPRAGLQQAHEIELKDLRRRTKKTKIEIIGRNSGKAGVCQAG
jgi:hypothetical protein